MASQGSGADPPVEAKSSPTSTSASVPDSVVDTPTSNDGDVGTDPMDVSDSINRVNGHNHGASNPSFSYNVPPNVNTNSESPRQFTSNTGMINSPGSSAFPRPSVPGVSASSGPSFSYNIQQADNPVSGGQSFQPRMGSGPEASEIPSTIGPVTYISNVTGLAALLHYLGCYFAAIVTLHKLVLCNMSSFFAISVNDFYIMASQGSGADPPVEAKSSPTSTSASVPDSVVDTPASNDGDVGTDPMDVSDSINRVNGHNHGASNPSFSYNVPPNVNTNSESPRQFTSNTGMINSPGSSAFPRPSVPGVSASSGPSFSYNIQQADNPVSGGQSFQPRMAVNLPESEGSVNASLSSTSSQPHVSGQLARPTFLRGMPPPSSVAVPREASSNAANFSYNGHQQLLQNDHSLPSDYILLQYMYFQRVS
nr:hypothetical protein [Tanacetum cinerariifolium]